MLRPTLLYAAILTAGLTGAVLAQDEPKLDNHGDPLPPGAVLRLGTIRLQATGGFAWMPDGKSLVTACSGQIWFWDVSDGRPLKTLPALGNTDAHHYSLAVSQDGAKLVCASVNGDLSIHDLKKGTEIARPRKRDNADPRLESPGIDELTIAPDGTSFVTANYQQNVRLWDTESGEVLLRLPIDEKRQSRYPCMAYSPDSRYLAYGCGTTLRVFDLEDLSEPAIFENAHGQETTGIAFTPDGKFLISAGTSPYERRKTEGGKSYVANHCELRIWNLAEKRLEYDLPFPEPMGGGALMALSPDGKMLVTMHRETSLMWDLTERKVIRKLSPLTTRYSRTRMKSAIDVSGKYMAFNSHSSHLRIWDLETGDDRFAPERRHNGLITAVACSPDGLLAAAGDSQGGVRLWNAKTGGWILALPEIDGWIRGLAFSKDNSHLFVGAEGHDKDFKFIGLVKAFKVADGSPVFERTVPNRVTVIGLSHDEKSIAVGSGLGEASLDPESDPMVHLCDAASGETLGKWKAGKGRIAALVWSKDDRFLVYAAEDNTIRTIDVKAGKETSQIAVPHERIQMDKVVPDHLSQARLMLHRERAITCTLFGNSIHSWNLDRGAKIWSLTTPGSRNMRIALSPDERVIASAWMDFERQQFGLTLWEVATRKQLLELAMPREQVYSIVFSPDGRRIVTGLESGSLLVWDVSAAWPSVSKVGR